LRQFIVKTEVRQVSILREKTEKTVMHSYPGMVALVTAEWNGRRNIMAAGWHSYISYEPPIYGVAIAEERFTHHLVKNSGEFAINFVPGEMAHHIQQAGVSTGEDIDKFETFSIEYEKGKTVNAPILKEAYVAYECKVIDIQKYGDHDWIVGQMSMFYKDVDRFQENGLPDWNKLSIPLYLGRSEYLLADKNAKFKTIRIP
jgi:flavin reductase (DIM6/NTAB) family NADH-FMN oxidoreductase RutF